METVLLILPVVTVLDVVTHQGGRDTLTSFTAELSWLLRNQVEVQGSVGFISSKIVIIYQGFMALGRFDNLNGNFPCTHAIYHYAIKNQ